MRVMFMGTPDFAVPALNALAAAHDVVCVVTAPDKPRNRMELTPTPVAARAAELGIRTEKPETLRAGAIAPLLAETAPDVIVVVAYGKILPPYVLEYARYGCLNVHGSLLPAYRGAAPMQRAIMDGVGEVGVTVMQMDAGLDTGDMLLKRAVELPADADFEWVHDTLAILGAGLLIRALDGLEEGSIVPQKQDGDLATYAAKITQDDCRLDFALDGGEAGTLVPEKQDAALATYAEKITREECALDFSGKAESVYNKIRALSPVPLSYAFLDGRMIKFVSARIADYEPYAEPGVIVDVDGGVTVACGDGAVTLTEILPEGKRRMNAADFARGRGVAVGDMFTKER